LSKLIVILTLISIGWYAPLQSQESVKVGSKLFTESVLLGEMATQIIESEGMDVEYFDQLGGTQILWNALIEGEIDIYPEYTGTITQEILGGIKAFEIDEMAFGLTIERITDETKAGQGTGASSSILKMYGTELNKLRQELFMAIGATDALNFDTDSKGALVRSWLRSKANSIEGGTTEVQLNIIAKRILGLPA